MKQLQIYGAGVNIRSIVQFISRSRQDILICELDEKIRKRFNTNKGSPCIVTLYRGKNLAK